MSQIRKLQTGGNTSEKYKFLLDSQEYDLTNEQLKEIDNRIAQLDPNLRRYLGNWTSAIRSGGRQGNRAENTVSSDMISGIGNSDRKRLDAKSPNFWESLLGTDSYYAKQAINEALNITNSVINNVSTPASISKTKRYNRQASFDYNTDENGNKTYSSNPKNKFIEDRFESYLNWLSDDKWGESNEWETSLGDNEAILRSWYNSFGNRELAKAELDKAMNEVRSKPWDQVSEETKELLAYFNIGNGATNTSSSTSSSQGQAPVDANGNIDTSKRTDNGGFVTWIEDGKLLTNSTVGNVKPYLLNEDRLGLYNLGQDYLNGLIYQGRIYKPSEVDQNIQLKDIMDRVITANNSATSTADVWANVGNLIDFTDNQDASVSYNSNSYYMPYQYNKLRSTLGSGNYSIFNPTNAYDTDGDEIFGVYDFNNNGTEQWGFRKPTYYIVGKDKSFDYYDSIPEHYSFLNRNWNPMNGYSGWENINGIDYGLVGSFWGSDAHDNVPYQIFEDRNGKFWTRRNNGKMQELDSDLVDYVLQGNKPNHNQMWHGTLSGKRRSKGYQPGGGFAGTREVEKGYLGGGYARVHKTGGKVELKPLPFKLQMGNKLGVAPVQPEQSTIQNDSPLEHASNVWETLTPADKKEITAAAIDVAGAIAGLVPGGSIAGAASGIFASTPLFMSAAKERKGHLDTGDWGQAALATGLDLVSLIPYLGETGKIAKIGKAVTRVAVPLGKAFSALGLVEASFVLTKKPSEWTTDDLLKLSAGIQSVVNIGHNHYVRRGESALASEITKIKAKEPLISPKYTSERFKTTEGNPIELEAGEISRIVAKDNKTPGETLRGILKSKGVGDDALKDITDKALLDEFGFVTGEKGVAKWKRTTATEPTREEYSKRDWIKDVLFDPLAKREFARRDYIDRNLADASVRSQLGPDVLTRTTSVTRTPREVITETITPTNTPAGRAYVQSLARQGNANTSWMRRASINPEDRTVYERPIEAYTESVNKAIAADAQEPISIAHDMARTAGKLGMEGINQFAQNETATNIASGVSKAMGEVPKTSKRVANLGASGVSNQDIKNYISRKAVTVEEAIELIKSLPLQKRIGLLKEFRTSNISKFKEIANNYRNKRTVGPDKSKSTKDLVAKTKTSISTQNSSRKQRAAEEARQVAENITAIRGSKDPMETLRSISQQEGFAKFLNKHGDELKEALMYAKENGNYASMKKRQQNAYDKQIESLLSGQGVLFKKGGILKAVSGLKFDFTPQPINGVTPIYFRKELTYTPTGDWDKYISRFKYNYDNSVTPQEQKEIDDIFHNSFIKPENVTSTNTTQQNTVGGFTKSIPSLSKYLLPGISLARFGINAAFQNKYYRQAVDALNAGRVDKLPTILNAPIDTNPTLDRALQQVQLERMAGMKPVTSDLIANNILWNQREAQLWNRENDIIGKRSQFGADIKNQILQIENQNLANQIETANDNAMRRAAINSAIKQQAMELTQRRGQSWDNLGLEFEKNIASDRQIMQNYQYSQYAKQLQNKYNQDFDTYFPGARSAYNGLSAEEAAKYSDLEDYVRRTRANEWNTHVNDLATAQENMASALERWQYLNGLYYSYPRIVTGKTSKTDIFKKGGHVHGKTRYTMEPDEQIWIDNNKATHKAIAKLSDNTIKLLLRALK